MTRLYAKVWLALVVAVFVSLVGGAVTARVIGAPGPGLEPPLHAFAVELGSDLPPEGAARAAALARRAEQHGVSLTLYEADGATLLAASGAPLPPPRIREGDHWVRGQGGAGMAIHLADHRWLVIGHRRPPTLDLAGHLLTLLGVVFAILAAAAWPIARMTTRRLELLRQAVDDLGEGELSARVAISGSDEVAQLARSFNASAGRIEALVEGQRRVLASASHELRSPLARIRMAAELARAADPAQRDGLLDQVERDVEELDALVGDLLLAGRLEAGAASPPEDEVDLGRLAREEAARVGAEVRGHGEALGDERMLRRLVRNLLENASRHGAPPVVVEVASGRLVVTDAGPGVPEAERDRVFEPFYRPQGHREADGGVGLGLSLVRRIADHHGARVTLSEGPDGAGTRVVVQWDTPSAAT